MQPIEFAALWPTHWVSYDEEISTVGLQDSWVGMPLKSILGAQRIDLDFRSIPGKCIPIEYLRIPGKGMFIYKSKLENFQVFRVRQFPAKIHCSDQFRNFFIEHNVTNIVFLEVGDVIE